MYESLSTRGSSRTFVSSLARGTRETLHGDQSAGCVCAIMVHDTRMHCADSDSASSDEEGMLALTGLRSDDFVGVELSADESATQAAPKGHAPIQGAPRCSDNGADEIAPGREQSDESKMFHGTSAGEREERTESRHLNRLIDTIIIHSAPGLSPSIIN